MGNYVKEKDVKDEENERWVKRTQEARTEGQVWEIVRRERRKTRGGGGEGIDMEEWSGYFKGPLEGVESKVLLGKRRGRRREDQEPLSMEEVRRALNKVKDNKACGADRIPGEVWKYGGEDIGTWVWGICNRI